MLNKLKKNPNDSQAWHIFKGALKSGVLVHEHAGSTIKR